MLVPTTIEQDTAIEGIARALGIHPDEVGTALIEAGLLWLTAKEIGQPVDGLDLEQWPGTARISRVLGAAYRNRQTGPLWTPRATN